MVAKPIAVALLLASLILLTAGGLRFAEGGALVGAEDARRSMLVLIGLFFAGYANYMPKQLKHMRKSQRVESQA